jgi:transcription antitermination protein NusB
MSLAPQKFREIVFQILYSMETTDSPVSPEIQELMMRELKVSRASVRDAAERAKKIFLNNKEFDSLIEKVCQNWRLDRLMTVEKTLLHLAIFELITEKTLPPKVVFSEAKRMARKFSSQEAASFIHALLSAIIRIARPECVEDVEKEDFE